MYHAADLVGAAVSLGLRSAAATDAAELLLRTQPESSPQQQIAADFLEPGRHHFRVAYSEPPDHTPEDIVRRIGKLKAVVRREPRNAVRWVDLARDYLILGQTRKAEDAVTIALRLSPENRFVLRSAAKFFEHQGDLGAAQALLEPAARTRQDPWLVAAAIALADLDGRSSRHIRRARELTEDGAIGLALAEVAGAMSMVEWRSGSDRRARQFARTALSTPTDNVLAQFEWARDRGFVVPDANASPSVPRRFEANSRHFAADLQWDQSLVEAGRWLRDEPFSLDAALHGSWAAAQAEQYKVCESFARAGQDANNGDVGLANNLAFGLAGQGRVDEAVTELRRALRLGPSARLQALLTATTGFVCFKLGDPAGGRSAYLKAYDMLYALDERNNAAMALVLLLEQELNNDCPDAAATLVKARRAIKATEDAWTRERWDRVEKAAEERLQGVRP